MFNKKSESNAHYLVLTEKDRTYGVHILSCGHQNCHAHAQYPPYEHPDNYLFNKHKERILKEYQLIYITAGKGKLWMNDVQYEIHTGTIIFIMPGQKHYYCPDENTGWEEHFIGFDGETAQQIISTNFSDDRNIFKIGVNLEMIQLYEEALRTIQNDDPMLQFRLSGIVMHMLGLISYEQANQLNFIGNHQQVANAAKRLMNEQISGQISPEEIAQKLQLSYSGFRTIFKLQTGLSPARYYKLLKIQKAKQYLDETKMPVHTIAKLLNYSSSNSFMISFKKNTGLSPLEYRNIPHETK